MKLDYISASKIKTLQDCKKLFYHTYIAKDLPETEDGIYAQLGSGLHKVLEVWRHDPSLTRREMVGIFRENFPPGKDHYLFKEACGMIYDLDLKKIKRGDLIATEKEFETEISGVKVKGVIDKLEKVGNKILVTDYKTNKQIEPAEYIHQLAIYDAIVEQWYPDIEREHELLYLRHNKSVAFTFTDIGRQNLVGILNTVNEMVDKNAENKLAWPKINTKAKQCSYCPFAKECW